MALTVNLEKATEALVLSLEKAGVKPPAMEVGIAMDVSGSFEDEHVSGVTNQLVTRLLPWGLAFDPDKKADFFTFSNGQDNAVDVGPVDARNYDGFIKRNVIGKVRGWCGGTDYSYVVEKMLEHFGWKPQEKKPGLFGRLLGQQATMVQGVKKRSLVIIITDGENSDKHRTMQVLEASESRKDEVYFLFIGVSNQGARFPFIEQLGDRFSNTGFVGISNLRQFVEQSDEQLNEKLIGDELIAWLSK